MLSKQCHKICICSVILGELESYRNYKGFSIILLKIIDALFKTYYERKNFSYSSVYHIFESEKFRFPFCDEK